MALFNNTTLNNQGVVSQLSTPIINRNDTGSNCGVVRFVAFETGTYDQPYARPYGISNDGVNYSVSDLRDELSTRPNDAINILTPVAGRILEPSAYVDQQRDQLNIAEGWHTRRIRFMLEIEFQTTLGSVIEYIIGYTDHADVSYNGLLDPRTRFYINSITMARRSTVNTTFGSTTYNKILSTNQLLADNVDHYSSNNHLFKMRPNDVVAKMMTHTSPDDSYYHELDTRVFIKETPDFNNRVYNSPGAFLGGVISAYGSANRDAGDIGQSESRVLSLARARLQPTAVTSDHFLKALCDLRNDRVPFNWFTLEELLRIDPSATDMNKFEFRRVGQLANTNIYSAGTAESWGSSGSREVQIASILSQAIPALMCDLGITVLGFTATNMISNAFGFNTVNSQVIINAANAFGGREITNELQAFKDRLEFGLLKDISYNNEVDYQIEMYVDLAGETRIGVSWNGGPSYPYVVPSFCDSIMAPVVSTTSESLTSLADGVSTILNGIFDNIPAYHETNFDKFF